MVLALSTTCDGCRELADVVRGGIAGFEVLGLLRRPPGPLASSDVAAFTGTTGRWVLGDDGFDALDVGSAPFFCVLDGTGDVLVEGVAFGRAHLEEHCARVRSGAPKPDSVRLRPSPP